MNRNKYIECGKIINTHGCRGGVKLESWCNTPKDLSSLKRIYTCKGGVYKEIKVIKSSVFKQFVIFELEGVNDMDSALELKNTVVYADRGDFNISDGEYFISDLEGLPVIDFENGTVYGKLTSTINRGASDIYVVETPVGEKMMPAVPEFVKKVDVEKGIFVKVIPGMLDDEQ